MRFGIRNHPHNDIPIGPNILCGGIQQQVAVARRGGELRLALNSVLRTRYSLFPPPPSPLSPPRTFDADVGRPIADDRQAVAAGKTILAVAVERRQALRVAEDDALFLPALQREDPHLERAAIDPFQQRRVLHAVDDRVEDLAGVLPLGHAAFHEPAVDVHRQPRQRGVGRQREIKRALQAERLVVEVGLVDRGPGKAVFDMHVDVVLSQAEPRFLSLRIDRHQAAAGIPAAGNEGRLGGGHRLADPLDRMRRAGAAEMSGGPAADQGSLVPASNSNCWPASTGSGRSLTCTFPWVTSSSVPAGATRTSNFVPRAIICRRGVLTMKRVAAGSCATST